jgi:hypothetical protein
MKQLLEKAKTLRGALTAVGLIIPIISATFGVGWWAYENMVFKNDLHVLKVDLQRDIFKNHKQMLRLRLSQVKSDIDVFAGAIRNLESMADLTQGDRDNLRIFKVSLGKAREEHEEIVNDITNIDISLRPNLGRGGG